MGLFIKRTDIGTHAPVYTIGAQRTYLIVGLGNPGKEYEDTRHNIGFACAEAFVSAHDELNGWVVKKDLKCLLAHGQFGDSRVLVIKPTTYMNLSGEAVQAIQYFYKVPLKNIVVIHDELDIPFGQIRSRVGGSSAGHNGVQSLIEHLGDHFNRIRIGIKNDIAVKADGRDFVLSRFTKEELQHIGTLKKEVNSILIEYIYKGELLAETRSFTF